MDPFLVPIALDDQPSPSHSPPQQQPSVDIHPLHPSAAALCRVRPLLPHDCAGQEASPISYPTPMDLCGRAIDVLQPGKTTRFTFNKVISPAASQQDVFGEVSKQVQSAVDDHKASILEVYNDKIKDLIVNQSTSLTIKQDAKRDAKSGAVGEQQKETQAINLSLFHLSELILALVKKRDHAP